MRKSGKVTEKKPKTHTVPFFCAEKTLTASEAVPPYNRKGMYA